MTRFFAETDIPFIERQMRQLLVRLVRLVLLQQALKQLDLHLGESRDI